MRRLALKIPIIQITIQGIAWLILLNFCEAQTINNRSKLQIIPSVNTYLLDSAYTIDKNSLVLINKKGESVNEIFYFNPQNGLLQFDSSRTDTLLLIYRKLPNLFIKSFYKRPVSLIEMSLKKDPFAYDPLRDGIMNQNLSGLKTDGNLSRGISAGNRQDLVVNSNLNLRLGGKIADDVNISGVISEDNNPIQPEGNTQQLQDFDKIFILLNKDSNNLIIGDFEMKTPGGYFMNYYKKSRGLHFDSKFQYKQIKTYGNMDAAISRGRFARNTIQGIEGNQGPYRLNGSNGETFIIIISGTEVIYLDGTRLNRGESNDYIINYNTGEITFMPSQMITRFSRIVAEFQYSDRNYQRTVYKFGGGLQKNNTTLSVNYFSEQDNKNRSFQQSLDGFDSTKNKSAKEILAQAGDNPDSATIQRIKTIKPFDKTKLLYRKTDTLGFKNIYVFTQNPNSDTIFYEVLFSLVGSGKGNYTQKISTTNGRIYEWISPVAGMPQGEYEPIEYLIAPKQFRMLTVGLLKKFNNTETFIEGVYTQNNTNTLSQLDKQNDDGFGMVTGIKNVSNLGNKLKLTHLFRSEFVNVNFKFLERYRPVEFERNWNKQINYPAVNTLKLPQILAIYDITLESKNKLKLNYKSAINHRSKAFSGLNNSFLMLYRIKNTRFQSSAEIMKNTLLINNLAQNNNFYNYDAELIQAFKIGKVGTGFHSEKSTFSKHSDSVNAGSFQFKEGKIFIESSDSSKIYYQLTADRREDKLPLRGQLMASTSADELKWKGGYTSKKGQRISINGSYRSLKYIDTLVTKGSAERNTLGRLESDFHFFKKSIKLNTFYQIGTGQEQKREFVFLKVADGNGIYIWRDYDSNNVESLNEFEMASDYDRKLANYIRTFLPVQGFIKSKNIQFNQTLNVTAPNIWNKKLGLKRFATRFSILMVYRTDRKTTSEETNLYLNPYIFSINDAKLLSSNASLRGVLFINRNNPIWSADINRIRSQSKNLLVNGFETRESDETTLNTRINFNRNYGTVIQLINGRRSYYSQILTNRNYAYTFYSAEPQLQYTSRSNNIGAAIIGKYYQAIIDTLNSKNLEAGVEIRLSKAGKGSFNGSFRLVNIAFNGDASSPLGYELMRGLLPGKNYTWNIVYQQRLSSKIQMDLSYDGRKSESSEVIHIGRVMIRYLF